MRILHVASECAPFSKTGGLADVVNALPQALHGLGESVAIVTPRHGSIDPERHHLARRLRTVRVPLGAYSTEVSVLEGRLPPGRGQITVWLVEHPLFERAGLYSDENGRDYPDNTLRYALFARAADLVARAFDFPADILHAHDWQAALSLFFARRDPTRPPVGTVLTVHNLAFQGLCAFDLARDLSIDPSLFNPEGVEFYGQVSFLKAGLRSADRLTTVSPRYAEEIQTPELGFRFDGLLRERRADLSGILNGIDDVAWNPERDGFLEETYSAGDLDGKAECKLALQRLAMLPERPRTPLCGAIARLTPQKGFDLVAAALEQLLPERDVQVVILGAGDPAIEDALGRLARKHPAKLALRLGYDERFAHRVYGGSDLFVMPSRFEPCGLGQMYALRYGAVPIVRATGGLDDTVVDYDPQSRSGTGFKFNDFSVDALLAAWRRALTAHAVDRNWSLLMKRGMGADFSWARSARNYRRLYQGIGPRSGGA